MQHHLGVTPRMCAQGHTPAPTAHRLARRIASAPLLSAIAVAPAAADERVDTRGDLACRYDHLQFFVDTLQPLSHYKAIEERLNEFAKAVPTAKGTPMDVAAAREAWCQMGPSADPDAFEVHGRDLVEQMLYGFGWRITGQHEGHETRSLLLSTVDPSGARFVVTCARGEAALPSDGAEAGEAAATTAEAEPFDHFARAHAERYFASHNNAQGVAVLGFETTDGELEAIRARYEVAHPKLVVAPPRVYEDGTRVFDVFAYYRGEAAISEADPGTLLRFVERPAAGGGEDHSAEGADVPLPLPGLEPVAAVFEPGVLPAYCDHWVSNVISRVGFLQTLEDTLGFVPKVDFNAGVVAAGEAQIESTVTGNTSPLATTDPNEALRDRAQVFLPTNNALSPVGHVHWYLEELGQGIQHIASRVASLPDYVQRANDMRSITGEGFTFLNIPRTYYGLLEPALLINGGRLGAVRVASAEGAAASGATAESELYFTTAWHAPPSA